MAELIKIVPYNLYGEIGDERRSKFAQVGQSGGLFEGDTPEHWECSLCGLSLERDQMEVPGALGVTEGSNEPTCTGGECVSIGWRTVHPRS